MVSAQYEPAQERLAWWLTAAHVVGLGVLWGTLAVVKALNPRQFIEFVSTTVTGGTAGVVLAWLLIGLEGTLAVLLFSGMISPTRARLALKISCVAALALLGVLLFGKSVAACGCFGKVVAATRLRRAVVAGVMLYIGGSALSALPKSMAMPAPPRVRHIPASHGE
jgi:hypothetical protein